MMNRMMKRIQRGQSQRQPPPASSSQQQDATPPVRQRPTLTRGQKSYSDSTMETVTSSDQNSLPSHSTRNYPTPSRSRSNSSSNNNNSSNHSITGSESNHNDNDITTATTSSNKNTNNNFNQPSRDEMSDDEMTHYDSAHHPEEMATSNSTTTGNTTARSATTTTATRPAATSPQKKKNKNPSPPPPVVLPTTKHTSAVSFADEYGSPPELIDSNLMFGEEELLDCFYTTTELNSFDRDRALTVLMYQTRNKSIPWDDNEHSLRGLEEYTTTTTNSGCNDACSDATTTSTSRRTTRNELIQSVLNEQTRLRDTVRGREEIVHASKVSGMSPEELIRELLRGVSCSLSKCDRHRAIQVAQKDEKEVNVYNPKWRDQLMSTTQYYNNIASMMMNQFTPNSRRRYLGMVKNKINDWSNSSNRSISSTGTCGDRSTTSSTTGGYPTNDAYPQHAQNSSRGGLARTKKSIARNNSHDDSIASDNHGNVDDIDDDDDDDNDDNHDDDDRMDEFSTNAVVRPPHTQQCPMFHEIASPLSLIRQVVYETSKEFDYDHSINNSPSSSHSTGAR